MDQATVESYPEKEKSLKYRIWNSDRLSGFLGAVQPGIESRNDARLHSNMLLTKVFEASPFA